MTPRQERFVAEYCIDRNGAAAARRAGFSPRAARQTASRLLVIGVLDGLGVRISGNDTRDLLVVTLLGSQDWPAGYNDA
jgi:hypothetical protein